MVRLAAATAAFTVGLLIGAAAFAQQSPPNAPATNALSPQGAEFVDQAAAGGMAEIDLSKIAEKSGTPEVKPFAERMVRDHTKANAQLAAIATRLGVTPPKTLDAEHQQIRERLQTLHGKPFDQEYVRVMVEDHDKAVKLFQQEAGSNGNGELKGFAQKTLPILEEHQRLALDLSRKMAANPLGTAYSSAQFDTPGERDARDAVFRSWGD